MQFNSMLYIAFFSIFLGILAQLLMKKGVNEIGIIDIFGVNATIVIELFTNKFVFLGIFCYIFGLFFWLIALSDTDVSKMYPLQGVGYVILMIGAFFFLGEELNTFRIIGITLITLGTFFLIKS